MMYSEVSLRYATSLYELAKDEGSQEEIFKKLQFFSDFINANAEIQAYVESPLVLPKDKEQSLKKALEGQGFGETFTNFILLLSKKDRLTLIGEITEAFLHKMDEAKGVTRGLVRSGTELSDSQKSEVEKKIASIVGKKVVLTYAVDASLHGGLSANVGGFIFDDSIATHLNKIQDDLNRRVH